MDAAKRKILLNEIEYWRRSKLLPEQYCDFLLNLYSDHNEIAATRSPSRAATVKNSKAKVWLLLIGLVSSISLLVLNFIEFPTPLQIILGVFFVLSFMAAGIVMRKRNLSLSYVCIGASCLLMLFLGEWMIQKFDITQSLWPASYLAICCGLWVVLGISLRMGFLHFCGWAGMMLVYGWFIAAGESMSYNLPLQAGWLPWSAVFIWFAWLARKQNQSASRVFLVLAVFSWLLPELYSVFLGEPVQYLPQIILIAKMFVAGLLLYVLRKRWIEWVIT